MPDNIIYAGRSNVGFKQKVNEDFIVCNDKSFGDDLFFIGVADGSGAKDSLFRPASVAISQVENILKRFYKENKSLLVNNIRLFLKQAVYVANDVLVAFKIGDEEDRMQFASTLTCAMIQKNGILTYAHTGNTRLYLVRNGKVIQMTKDQTEGQKLVDQGTISETEYYTAYERLRLYSGLGMYVNPEVETKEFKLKKNDVVIISSDGIHYAYRSDYFYQILMETKTMDDAADRMIQDAIDLHLYPDNLSVVVAWYLGDGTEPAEVSGQV